MRSPSWAALGLVAGSLLPWDVAGRSGALGRGAAVLVLGLLALGLLALVGSLAREAPPRWSRPALSALGVACLFVALPVLAGHGSLGPGVTAASAVAMVVLARRRPRTQPS